MKPGDLSVATTWRGEPRAILETTSVVVLPFEEVSADFARDEGEGDLSLQYWRDVHWAYFERECRKLGQAPSLQMPIVCERFRVLDPGLG